MDGSWQARRSMSANEYVLTLHQLGLSAAAAGRYLGVSSRTARRYANAEAEIPVPIVLLLRALVAHDVKPVVPPWSTSWEGQR